MQEHRTSGRLPVPVLALSVFLVSSQSAFAVRLVRFEIIVDRNVVLDTSTGDHAEDADTVWGYLKDLKLRPVKAHRVDPDRGDPLRATLKGKVIIQVDAGGRAEVSELKLVREKEDAPWKIAPAEVERTFKSRHKPFVFLVSIDGKTALSTGLQTRAGGMVDDSDNVWLRLKQLQMFPISRYKVEADRDDPLQATLRGNVIVQVVIGGHTGDRAEVSELKLVRDRVNARWKVDPKEVERTFKSRKKPE